MAEETTVQFPLTEELQQLIEAAEATGVIEHADLMEAIETIEYEPTDLEILLRELEDRGIELVDRRAVARAGGRGDDTGEGHPGSLRGRSRDDDGRAPALPARDRPPPAAHRR